MPALVVCGVAGSGKSTVALAVAEATGSDFIEADEFHTAESVERMRRGLPLTDADRAPWLASIRSAVAERLLAGTDVTVACSALTRAHREALLVPGHDVRFLQLAVPRATSAARLGARADHFAGPALAESQHAALEPLGAGEPGTVIDGTMPLDRLIAAATAYAREDEAP